MRGGPKPLCFEKRMVQVGNQVPQLAMCSREVGHEGQHMDVVLDSDDNAITYRWS